MLGDWTLIATANVPSRLFAGKTTVGVYDTDEARMTKELNPIQKAIQRTINVTQRIRSIDDDESSKSGMIINRVDNVIELTPLTTLDGILPTDSPLSSSLNKVLDIVNPLKVQRAKIVLIHKAKVESIQPVLRTKIAYTSTVINVAGGDNTS
jgi:ribosome-interacting GTPase 1